MLQDLEAGKTMEIDALVTAVVEMGRITGHPTLMSDLNFKCYYKIIQRTQLVKYKQCQS